MVGIHLKDINLQFRVRKSGRIGLKEFVVRGLFRETSNPYLEINALQNINLSIKEGERVGIIGHNGAGKSTILRLMAGVYPPSSGERHVEGKISSLMDIGLGIEPNASGWDNIAYRCYLQGDTPADVEAKRQDIADFCELGDLLQMPIRYYSSGMYVRFAFAVATAVEPEILLLDEVFGAGDITFQQKARKRMLGLVDKSRLMVFVSHDLNTMQDLCSRVIWMEKGTIIQDGATKEIMQMYRKRQEERLAKAA
jgi:ABC-type polysaccharide/polyol phosphate transport system ATPase subunit